MSKRQENTAAAAKIYSSHVYTAAGVEAAISNSTAFDRTVM
jgi:hypothetical protein